MSGPASPEERRGYARGYRAGRERAARDVQAAGEIFDLLLAGLVASGVSLDAVLDLMIAGAKARAGFEA